MHHEDFLSEYDESSQNTKQIISKLKELGYDMLGYGYDSTVWSKDAGSVIKIIMPSDVVRAEGDSAFINFYEFCKANTSPFLPKFVSIGGEDHTVFTLNDVPYRQISMEKLKPIPVNTFNEQMVWALSELAVVPFIKWRDAKKQITQDEFWKHFDGPGDEEDVIRNLTNPQTEHLWLSFLDIIKKLYIFGRGRGMGWDLHTENVMMRGEVPVIIDPFTGS